jgi:SecD/SecF fusion protein
MLKRLIIVAVVLLTALGLMTLQNKVLVGTQELNAEIRLAAPAAEAAGPRTYDVVFRDVAGNPVEATEHELESVRHRLAGGGRDDRIAVEAVEFQPASHSLRLTAPAGLDEMKLRQRLTGRPFQRANEARPFWHVNLGIDLRGGVEFLCRLKNADGADVAADDEVIGTLRARLDERGLTEPVVARLSNGDVQIVIPGGSRADAARTRKVLETTGRLEFREVIAFYPGGDFPSTRAGDPDCAWVALGDGRYRFNPRVPVGSRQDIIAPEDAIAGLDPQKFYHLGPVRVSGKDVANAGESMRDGQPSVAITFTAGGASRNFEFTSGVKERGDRKVGTGCISIVFDGVVKSAPVVISPSSQNCEISGRFTSEEIKDLKGVLKAGSLAVTPVILSERVVGATLGMEEVGRALTTMFWCVGIVIIFLAWYYRRLGLVAMACMAICAGLTWSTVSIFGATLTLPGLAGVILSIAMSIDTNVLIYERIREEQADDKGLPAAIEAGYDRVFLTVIDSHLTTMATGLVLYLIGTGTVQGFGLTLIIGVGISLFTGIFCGRLITDWLCRGCATVSMSSFFKPMPFGYVKVRGISYVLTFLTAIAGLGWFAFGHRLTPGATFERNFDIEFTGGTLVQLSFQEPQTAPAIEQALAAAWAKIPEDRRAVSLLAPGELQKQPYFASLAEAGESSRQWVFRVRDLQGAALEAELSELQRQRAAVVREQLALREGAQPDPAAAKRLDKEKLEPLIDKIRNVQERISDRTEAFKRELAGAFAGMVAAEGAEVLSATWAGTTLGLRLATIDVPAALTAGEIGERVAHLGSKVVVAPAPGGLKALDVQVTFLEKPKAGAGAVEALDPVGRHCADLLAQGGVAAADAKELGAVGSAVVEAVAEAGAGQRLPVAQPFPASQHFSGQVAGRMQIQALVAVAISLLAMMLYIAARFELAFGIGATISLVHVVLQTVGLIAIFGIRIDLTVIAGVLTVIGYAINDTIVLYDRIRENLVKMAGKPLSEVLDASIAQNMPRTILTGGCVITSLIIMLIFAGDSLWGFAATLLIGTLLGTYSSVFVASPLLLSFRRKVADVAAAAQAEAEAAKDGVKDAERT